MEELKAKFRKNIIMAVVAVLLIVFFILIACDGGVEIQFWLPEIILGSILLIIAVGSAIVTKSDLDSGNFVDEKKK